GKIDPISDIEVINTELALADSTSADKALQKAQKTARSGDKEAKKLCDILELIIAALNEGRAIRSLSLDEDQQQLLRGFGFITAKPAMYVANVQEDGFENNEFLEKVQDYAEAEGSIVVAVCAAIEAEIADLDEEDKSIFSEDMGMNEPGLNRVIRAAYKLL